jgi:hypothetical protein
MCPVPPLVPCVILSRTLFLSTRVMIVALFASNTEPRHVRVDSAQSVQSVFSSSRRGNLQVTSERRWDSDRHAQQATADGALLN